MRWLRSSEWHMTDVSKRKRGICRAAYSPITKISFISADIQRRQKKSLNVHTFPLTFRRRPTNSCPFTDVHYLCYLKQSESEPPARNCHLAALFPLRGRRPKHDNVEPGFRHHPLTHSPIPWQPSTLLCATTPIIPLPYLITHFIPSFDAHQHPSPRPTARPKDSISGLSSLSRTSLSARPSLVANIMDPFTIMITISSTSIAILIAQFVQRRLDLSRTDDGNKYFRGRQKLKQKLSTKGRRQRVRVCRSGHQLDGVRWSQENGVVEGVRTDGKKVGKRRWRVRKEAGNPGVGAAGAASF